jgi:phytoene dehydrogenase-like protein
MHTKNAGFPLGGSLQFAKKIADRYLELGGKIHYESQVEKILVERIPNSYRSFGAILSRY